MNAYENIVELLEPGEILESVVFGAYGDNASPGVGERWKLEYGEPDPPPVPFDKRGVVLPIKQAKQYMQGWSCYGGYGLPETYALAAWSNRRIFFIVQYDGSTTLHAIPRNPTSFMPEMPGGG